MSHIMERDTGNLRVFRRFQSVRVGVTIVENAHYWIVIISFLPPHQARSAYHLGKQAQLDKERAQNHRTRIYNLR